MNVTFSVRENFLIYSLLCSERHTNENITSLQNDAWQYSSKLYSIITGRCRPSDVDDIMVYTQVPDFLEYIRKSSNFNTLMRETTEFKQMCECEWNAHISKSLRIVQDITGFDFTANIHVTIVHPDLKEGRHVGPHHVVWGCHNEWPGYSVVYIWHEILHDYLGYGDSEHAIIQFITDNELRVQLNGGVYPPFEGHPHLFPIMERLLPEWRSYLAMSAETRNFKKLCSSVSSK